MTEPTRQQWQSLHQAADTYRRYAPWQWMTDEDMFAVEDPMSGETGYCLVLGGGGMEYGLAVYLGAAGLADAIDAAYGYRDPEDFEDATDMRSLSVLFGRRDVLDSYDHKIIRDLGIKYRGNDAWPWIRSMIPGYFPWRLDQDECRLLETALVQGIEVAQRVQAGELELTTGMDGEPIFTRCLRDGVWVDEWRDPPDVEAILNEPVPPPDELRLKRLRKMDVVSDARWQVDLFRLPTPVGERNVRPYFPNMLMVVNRLGLVMNVDLFKPSATASEIQAGLLDVFEKIELLPGELQVNYDWLFRIFQPIADALKIPLTLVEDELEDLEEAKESILEMQRRLYE